VTATAERQRSWYIVHTYSGFEERVKERCGSARTPSHGRRDREIRIPMETVVENKGGKKRETQRKFFRATSWSR